MDKYLGTWNYDQPDRDTMRNIAQLTCPDTRPGCDSANPLAPPGSTWQIPQIGRIVFSKEPGGKVVGRTDRGCTWRFTARRDSLQLDPPGQSCENQVIKSGYTITNWSVTVSGRHERETIVGVSHNRRGEFDFVLKRGARTKAKEEPPAKVAKRFAGQWKYAPADPWLRQDHHHGLLAGGGRWEATSVDHERRRAPSRPGLRLRTQCRRPDQTVRRQPPAP
ncbi:hypothetical protein [Nonomuraea sp. B5E05]|uniref:hypothetical protein n=1 Tax=Nonomuraea sp. B5E05 TaxID=3153569 RepID=UPI00326173D8